MRSLGSNFLLDGSSLGITIEKPFEILIKNKVFKISEGGILASLSDVFFEAI
jgi:hypothetical protein